MRCLDRDRRRVLLGRFAGIAPVEDAQGRYTGRNAPAYAEPVELWPTMAPARGEAQGDYFGQRLDYDLTLTVDDPKLAVREADVLWVDADPDGPHDHVVRRVARTPGFTVIAAKRVEVAR